MTKHILIFLGVLAVIALIAAFFVRAPDVVTPLPDIVSTTTPSLQTYISPEYGISFDYPTKYYLAEDIAPVGRANLSLTLVQDTAENRDVLEGRVTEAREGPTAITVMVYPNPDSLPAEDWVRSDANWNIRNSDVAPMGRGSLTGVTYTWSGLYEGRSVIATRDTRAYVFSVTWMTPDDDIVAVFDKVLSSVLLSAPVSQ